MPLWSVPPFLATEIMKSNWSVENLVDSINVKNHKNSMFKEVKMNSLEKNSWQLNCCIASWPPRSSVEELPMWGRDKGAQMKKFQDLKQWKKYCKFNWFCLTRPLFWQSPAHVILTLCTCRLSRCILRCECTGGERFRSKYWDGRRTDCWTRTWGIRRRWMISRWLRLWIWRFSDGRWVGGWRGWRGGWGYRGGWGRRRWYRCRV